MKKVTKVTKTGKKTTLVSKKLSKKKPVGPSKKKTTARSKQKGQSRLIQKKNLKKDSTKVKYVANWINSSTDFKFFDPLLMDFTYEVYPPVIKVNRKIKSIIVEKLFGKYSYNLKAPIDFDKLIVLYGDNGTGKTTIMRLIFDMLSSADNRGHRNNLADIKFKKVYIEFNDGSYVLVDKRDDFESGAFKYEIKCNNKIVKHEFKLRDPNRNVVEWGMLIEQLKALDLTLYYLGDDRRLISDVINPEIEKIEMEKGFRSEIISKNLYAHQNYQNNKGTEILVAMQRTILWLREQAFTGVKDGVLNIQSMYEQSIQNVATKKYSSNTSLEELRSVLHRLQETSIRYSSFGLTPALNINNMINILNDINPDQFETINLILNPYINSLTARYEAFVQVFDLLEMFQNKINSFLFDKELRISVDRGIQFFDRENNLLSPAYLSSGEKHLLLLVCTILSTRNSNAIFLIDEPEISLNIKWQRQLLPTLMSLSKSKNIQFIIATHSIELLTQQDQSVVVLKNSESY